MISYLKVNFVFDLNLVRLPTETVRVFFSESFPALSTCSMHGQDFLGSFLSPSHVKYYINSQIFPPF